MDILEDVHKVKTRKEHVCFACLRKFPKGTEMYRQVNVFDGEIYQVYHDETCEKIMTNYKDVVFDEVEGVFHEGCVRDIPVNYFSRATLIEMEDRSPEKILEMLEEGVIS